MITTREKEKIAHKNCANYDRGKCLGVIMGIEARAGYIVRVGLKIDNKKSGRLCIDIVDSCEYFDYIVNPSSHKSP